MSRCFPFPPPGYDKKFPFDAEKWLEKEKQEKKHKKEKRDKKDKDKKDRKEKKRDKKDKKTKHKKEKERSEDEQREKKDSTEKLKDNDKHRETELKNMSVENDKNDTVGPLKYNSFKNLGSNCTQRDDASEFQFLLDSGKRARDDIKVKVSPLVQNLTGRSNPEVPGTVLKDKRDNDRKVYGQSKEFVARSHNNCSLPSYIGGDEKKVAWVPGLADKRTTEQKENGMHKNVDGKKDGRKDPNREKQRKSKGEIGGDKAIVKVPDTEQLKTKENSWNPACFDDGKPSPLSKADNKTSNLGKRKALETNDVLLHVKESQPNKLPRFCPPSNHDSEGGRNSEPCMTPTQPTSKFAEKVQNHKVSSKFSYNGSKLEVTQANGQLVSERQENCDSYNVNNNIRSSHPIVQNDGGALNMSYAIKQFASERLQTSNGHNMDEKISLCHPAVRIGKVVDEAVTHLSSGGDVMIDDKKVNHNDLKINGLEEGKKLNVSSTRPSSKKVKKNEGISVKPPHPDSKYLKEILNIPSVEWPDMDNQEWLFSGRESQQSNKSTSGSSQVAEVKHVWSKALRIESADITALPYVIPY